MDLSVYNHLMSANLSTSRLKPAAHKSSELRSIYNQIRKVSKDSPLYLIRLTDRTQNFALSLKESSLRLHQTLESMEKKEPDSILLYQKAQSDDASVSAHLLSTNPDALPEEFYIEVDQVAKPQKNSGYPLYASSSGPNAGNYTFRLLTGNQQYDFRFPVGEKENNLDILTRMQQFINQSHLGIQASLDYQKGNDTVALNLESTGEQKVWDSLLFQLRDLSYPGMSGIIEYYDLNHVTQRPSNASFLVNGTPQTATSNEVLVNKTLSLAFHEASQKPVFVHFVPDTALINQGMDELADQYNQFVGMVSTETTNNPAAGRILNILHATIQPHKNQLESAGITFDEEGYMHTDHFLTEQAAVDQDLFSLFEGSTSFGASLSRAFAAFSLNPMEYVDKKIVTYPNFSKPGFSNPYMTSAYSGLFFNSYC
ncbi:MAG: hypothetical protein PUB10_05790 [Clostridiales bacterium]|nr:hypothetical protein [Clostridiales bacterium]